MIKNFIKCFNESNYIEKFLIFIYCNFDKIWYFYIIIHFIDFFDILIFLKSLKMFINYYKSFKKYFFKIK